MSEKKQLKGKAAVFDYIFSQFGLQSEEYSFKFNDAEELIELDLSENELNNISALSNLTTLQVLDLSKNQLLDISAISKLSSLKVLLLSNNEFIDIKTISNLSSLVTLDISHNEVYNIKTLTQLVKLKELYISNINIENVDFLLNIKARSLTVLDASHNYLTNIAPLARITSLRYLHLDRNFITNISPLSSLKSLIYLNLFENQIKDISPLSRLIELNFLNISHNKVEDLSPLENIKSFDMLSIHDNPCVENENLGGLDNHIAYLNLWLAKNKLADKIQVLLPKKVVFLGNHASGKSSLLHYLLYQKYAPETSTTHVLNVIQYQLENADKQILKKIFSHIPNIEDILPIMYYDFGGQDFYHGLYQSFSSKVAFQIIVYCAELKKIKLIKDSKNYDTYMYPLSFWLKEKEYLEAGIKNPYFIIENKIDTKAEEAFMKEYPDIHNFQSPRGIFHLYLKTLNISNPLKECHNKLQLEFLKKQLLIELFEPQEISKTVVEFYKNVYADSISEELIIRNISEYTSRIEGISEENMLTQLKLLENSGVLFLSANQTEVIANPKAFIKHIHKNILKKKNIFKNKGKLSYLDWKAINKGEHSQRVEIFMMKQKTMFIDKYTKEYIFPNYLTLFVQDEERHFLNIVKKNIAFYIKFEHFIPFGYINVLIHHFGKEPNKKKFWRDAIYFIQHEKGLPKADVFILINIAQLTIEVSIELRDINFKIERYKHYLWYCLSTMYHQNELIPWNNFNELINTKYKNTNSNYPLKSIDKNYTDLPEATMVSVDGNYYISLSQLDKHIQAKEYNIQLINEKGRNKLFPINKFQIFTDKNIKKMKKIFISYSNADIYYKKELDKFIKPFQKFQLANSWSCEEITPGLWDDQIQEELESSDIIIFMMSMNFASSDYILKEEVYNTFKQMAVNPNKKIVCILVKQFPWNFFSSMKGIFNIKDGDINDVDKAGFALANLPTNQFIPFYTDTSSNNKDDHKRYLKPINQWEYEEEAYTQIVEILGKII